MDHIDEHDNPEPTPAEQPIEPAAAPVDEDTPAEEREAFVPSQKPVTFEESQPTTKPLEQDVTLAEVLHLFRESYSTVNTLLAQNNQLLETINQREEKLAERLKNQGKFITDDDGNAWFRTVMDALRSAQLNLTGEAALTREGSSWAQAVDHEGKTLRAGQPKQKLSGHASLDEKMTYLSRKAGVGIVFDVPLYHSGVWVRLKTPPLVALTGLQHQLQQLKVTLGSDSKGMAFSNTAQALTATAVDLALQYVIDSNVHFTTPSDLKEKIKVLDIPMLLWGLAVTLYPKGYPYAHPCVSDMGNCEYIHKETLNLNRLFWVDTVSLTATQRKLMARRFEAKLTDDEQRLYQTDHQRGGSRLMWFEDIGLTLKVPTLQEYEEAGQAWIDGIITMTQGAFNEPPHGSNRDAYISRLGVATTCRQYAHWIESVHERDEDGEASLIGNEVEVINELLNHVFSTDEYADRFFDAVTKFMDDSLIGLIAVPSFNCPACNTPQATKFHERFPHLVPLDVLTTFFTLVNRKLV